MLLPEDFKLLNTKSYECIKQICEEWTIIKKNMQDRIEQAKIFLPNYFFIVDPGVGLSYIAHILSEHLYNLGIMPFSNAHKYIEFILEYDENPQSFKSFERLYNLLEHGLSQYGFPYAGVLMIHITDWVLKGAYAENRFQRFLEYLKERDDIQMIILVSESSKIIDHKLLESIISGKLRIQTVSIKTSPAQELRDRLVEMIHQFGLSIDEESKEFLLKTVKKIMKKRAFHGIDTIKNLAKDVVYEVYRKDIVIDQPLTPNDLVLFHEEGPWVKKLDAHI